MPLEMAIWKMTDTGPQPIKFEPLSLERRLETMLVADPSLIGVDPAGHWKANQDGVWRHHRRSRRR